MWIKQNKRLASRLNLLWWISFVFRTAVTTPCDGGERLRGATKKKGSDEPLRGIGVGSFFWLQALALQDAQT
jgi:hypothetical protein